MKALFVGAGSIGKRHMRDFYAECKAHELSPEIYVLRRKIGTIGEEDSIITKQITEIDDCVYDVAFITNPTKLHFDALRKIGSNAKWFFIEKPIFEKCEYEIADLGISDSNAYIAAPMRHTLVFQKLKEIVDSHKVYSSRVICSSFLPEWRKGVDYRTVYSAKKDMGGGVNLDLIHEIDYVYDLFGEPELVLAASGKYSDLEITSNDLSAYIMKYKDKICEIHLDYFGRKNIRSCEVFTEEGMYIADFFKEIIVMPDGNELDCHVMANEEFINEMHYFFQFINGEVNSINPPSLAIDTLKIALKGDIR